MKSEWVVKTTNSATDFERILNEFRSENYRVQSLTALENGNFVAIARLEQ